MWRPDRQAEELSEQHVRELEALDLVLARGRAGDSDPEHAVLARLVAAVRDDHLPLRPAFADELGLRVSAGFARRPGREAPEGRLGAGRPRRERTRLRALVTGRPTSRRWLVGLGAAASVAVGVVVVGGSPGSTSNPVPPVASIASGPATDPVGPAAQNPASGQLARPAPSQTSGSTGTKATAGGSMPSIAAAPATSSASLPIAPSPPAAPALGGTRSVESDASLALLAPRGQVQKVADETIAATDRLGGIVTSSDVTLGDQGGSQATLALAVPSTALDRTLAAISSLAHVSARAQNTLDITDPTRAARDRLSQSRAERLALLRQLGRATTADQVASIHAQLGLVAGRIAQDEASLRALVHRAGTASVNVTIDEAGRGASVVGGSGWGPNAALGDALQVLEVVFAVFVIALAVLAPAGGLAAVGWYSVRAVRRRRRQGALAA